jgi:glycerol-3-phosphate dehydrogenase
VREAFAGLRVLPIADNQFAARHRETILQTDSPQQPRMLTIYGGKLTAYRATAEKVMRMLQRSLPHRAHIADTRTLKLGRSI